MKLLGADAAPVALAITAGQLLFSGLLLAISWVLVTGPDNEAIRKAIALCLAGPLLVYLIVAGPITLLLIGLLTRTREYPISRGLAAAVYSGGLTGVAAGEAVAGALTVVAINTTHPHHNSLSALMLIAFLLWFLVSTVVALISVSSKVSALKPTTTTTTEGVTSSD